MSLAPVLVSMMLDGFRVAVDEAGLRADIVETADVRMGDGRKRARFAFEAAHEFGAARLMRRKDFDGDAAI
jgi:hypothetical protein